MDQYTNSILQLPEFETTRAITYAEKQIGGHRVIIETLHGRITGAVPDSCPHCGGRLHANQQLHVQLHHLTLGDRKIVVDVGYEQLLCTRCRRTARQAIPFKVEGHCITTCLQAQIRGFLGRCDMTVKGLAGALCTNRKLVRELDKERLRDRYGPMLPTHASAHLCVDEFSLHKGHRYATVVLDWETGEILFLEEGNSERQLLHFFQKVGRTWMMQVKSISMDMNAQYCKAVEGAYPHIAIVYDAFHICKNFNDRILTELRRLEQNRLQEAASSCRAKLTKLRKALCDAAQSEKPEIELEVEELRTSVREAGRQYAALKGSRFVITSSRDVLKRKDELAREHNRHLAQRYENKGLPLPNGERKWSIRNVSVPRLTWFTAVRCAGPAPQHRLNAADITL